MARPAWELRATITRWVSHDPQPGMVECQFTDAWGAKHMLIEKQTILTVADLWIDSVDPQPGRIGCSVVSRTTNAEGREIVRINIGDGGWHMETIDGSVEFDIFADELLLRDSTLA